MFKSTLLLLICISSFYVNAQIDHNLIIVKYKDRATYIGEKLSEEDGIIRIKLKNRDKILVENKQEVIHVDRRGARKVYDNQNSIILENGKFHQTKGYFVNLPSLVGISSNIASQSNISINRFFNKKLTLGLGIGSQFNEFMVAGLYLDNQIVNYFSIGRYYLTHKKQRVFANGKIGYGHAIPLSFGESVKGGLQAGVGLGVSFASRRKVKYMMALENFFQKTSGINIITDQFGNEFRANYNFWLKRIVFKFGFDF